MQISERNTVIFSKDEDLVSYFDEVLERRDLIESMEQDERDYTI